MNTPDEYRGYSGGDIMSTPGGYHDECGEYHEDVQYTGGCSLHRGISLSTPGGCLVHQA